MRRMHTLLLPDGGRLFAADCLADVVEDGEELQPVFDRGGTSTPAASVVAVGPRGEDVGGGEGEDGGEERSEVDLTPALAAAPAAPYSGRRKVNLVRVSFTSDPDEDPAAARLLCALQQRTGRDSNVLQFMAWGVDQPEDVGQPAVVRVWAQAKSEGATAPRLQRWARIFRRGFVEPVKADVWLRTLRDRSDQGPGLFCSPATVRITAMTKVAVGTHICGDWNTMLHHFNDIFAELSRSAAVAVQAAVEWRENVVRIDLVPRERAKRMQERRPFTWTPETTVLLLQGVRQKSFVSVCHETLNVEVGDGGYLGRMQQFMSNSLKASMHAGLWDTLPKNFGPTREEIGAHLNRLKLTYGSDHQGFVECERAFIHAVAHGPPGRVHMSVPGEFFGIPSIAPLDLRQRSRPCSSSGSAEASGGLQPRKALALKFATKTAPFRGLLVHAADDDDEGL